MKPGIRGLGRIAAVLASMAIGAACALTQVAVAADVQPVNPRCEYLVNPLAISVTDPCLSWELQAADPAKRGLRQSAYRVIVAGSREILARNEGDLWDSGKVLSDRSVGIVYAGKPLASRQRCCWKVMVWDQDGQASPWGAAALWTMALLQASDWRAQWIGAPEAELAAPYLRTQWTLPQQPVRATAYFCGLGYGELYINGRKVGNHVLDPGFTDYTERVLYVAHDVTDQLTAGENAVGILLGNGWFRLPTPDLWGFHKAIWRGSPRALLQLEVEYADGSRATLVTSDAWKWALSPIIFNCVRAGEVIDVQEDRPGWDKPKFDDAGWRAVSVLPAPLGKLVAQQHPPIRAVREIRPLTLTQPKPGIFVYDLGEYISGWPRYHKRKNHGEKVTLTCGERLDTDGTLTTRVAAGYTYGNYQTEIAVGKPATYEPRFTYHGYRYVQLDCGKPSRFKGDPGQPTLDDLVGVVVRSDLPPAGGFTSSDETLNAVKRLLLNGAITGVMGSMGSDPSREKLNWMCDGIIVTYATAHDFDVLPLCRKWVNDMLDAQDSSGQIHRFAPWPHATDWATADPLPTDPWWGSDVASAPWFLYCHYGDRRTLRHAYPAMKRFLDRLTRSAQDGLIRFRYGDWLARTADEPKGGVAQNNSRAPVPLVGTAGWYYMADLVARIADTLGEKDDAAEYRKLADRIRETFIGKFIDRDGRLPTDDDQTAPSLALALGLAPAEHRQTIVRQLVDNVTVRRSGHLNTGFVGLRFLPRVLTDNGRADVAVRALTIDGFPGYVNMIRHGATTTWEDWRGDEVLIHPGLTAPCRWLYEGLAGIQTDPAAPGFKRMIFKPAVVEKPEVVEAWHQSPYGRIAVRREIKEGRFTLVVDVPPNATAEVHVPAADAANVTEGGKPVREVAGIKLLRQDGNLSVFEIGSGRYQFAAMLAPRS